MRVGIDISQTAHSGGVSVYTNNLTSELIKFKDFDFSFLYASLRKKYSGNLPNVKTVPIPPTLLELLSNKLRLFSIDSVLPNLDLFHSSDWTQPKTKAKKVTTYHDVIPLKFPELSHPKIVAVQKERLKIVEKEIDMVIAVSQNTKKDLLEISNLPQEKIVVIYEGVSKVFRQRSEEEIKKFKEKHFLPDKYIASVSGIGKRKNLDRIKEGCKNIKLVVVGVDLELKTDEELNLFYAASEVLVYAPLYEGFGLPILEGFASGVPVICSNTSSMPEVGGDAALYVDPLKPEEISKKIDEVLNNQKLKNKMITEGLKRAKEFTWEKCAEKTLEVYKKVLQK